MKSTHSQQCAPCVGNVRSQQVFRGGCVVNVRIVAKEISAARCQCVSAATTPLHCARRSHHPDKQKASHMIPVHCTACQETPQRNWRRQHLVEVERSPAPRGCQQPRQYIIQRFALASVCLCVAVHVCATKCTATTLKLCSSCLPVWLRVPAVQHPLYLAAAVHEWRALSPASSSSVTHGRGGE